MQRILILGGGYAGYYTAKGLEKKLKPGEAEVTIVDYRANLVYQPFLAEVASGAIEGRHVQVSLRQHLRNTKVVQARVTGISAADKLVHVTANGEEWSIPYDQLVVTLGGVTKTFPTPGIADHAVGLKTMEEAVYIRDTVINNIGLADTLPADSPQRKRLLTYIVVGGGFSGIEGFAEILSLIQDLLKVHTNVKMEDIELHLIEAADRIMPEIPPEKSPWVIEQLEKRGAHIHLKTFVEDATDGIVKTSTGESYDASLLVWTAGQTACPALKNSDLPLEPRGRLRCRTDLRVEGDDGIVADVWGCGDATMVEDLSGGGLPDKSCAPTAQHAMRQSKVLVNNLVASIRGGQLKDYFHKNAGCVAGLGRNLGMFANGNKKFIMKGWIAWMAHRVYHGFALPTWERKWRCWGDWTRALFHGRDITPTTEVIAPRDFFQEFALRPAPKPEDAE